MDIIINKETKKVLRWGTSIYDSETEDLISKDVELSGEKTYIYDPETEQFEECVFLEDAKKKKISKIDARTEELIDQGFNYSDLNFGLTQTDQLYYMGLDVSRGDFEYPYSIPNSDFTDTLEFEDADEVHQFFLAGVEDNRSILQSGILLKQEVMAAISVEEVESIEDTR